jgi:hypothetical protein
MGPDDEKVVQKSWFWPFIKMPYLIARQHKVLSRLLDARRKI